LVQDFNLLGCVQVLSGVALLSYKAAKAPRDKDHPYGQLPISFLLVDPSSICG
jgi:hypothetical protein